MIRCLRIMMRKGVFLCEQGQERKRGPVIVGRPGWGWVYDNRSLVFICTIKANLRVKVVLPGLALSLRSANLVLHTTIDT